MTAPWFRPVRQRIQKLYSSAARDDARLAFIELEELFAKTDENSSCLLNAARKSVQVAKENRIVCEGVVIKYKGDKNRQNDNAS